MDSFNQIHSSDLERCIDTSFYSLGFPTSESRIKKHRDLRELNFGDHEGLHFDGLSPEEKAEFRSLDFKAPNGESWLDVKLRVSSFLWGLDNGSHLVYTHGGPLTTLLLDHGVRQMPSNGSFYGVIIKPESDAAAGVQADPIEVENPIERVEFSWEYPMVEEEI